jgi:hypothetical protein
MEEQYQTLSLDIRTAVTAEKCTLLSSYTAGSGNVLLTSVRNYHYLLCNNPEECSSHLLRGRSVKSCSTDCSLECDAMQCGRSLLELQMNLLPQNLMVCKSKISPCNMLLTYREGVEV